MSHENTDRFKRFSFADFGSAATYKYENGTCIKQSKASINIPMTKPFFSRATLQGLSQSRRDDMEVLGYVLLELGGFKLPWTDCKTKPEMIHEQDRLCNALDVVVRSLY